VEPLARIEALRWRYSIGSWVLNDVALQVQPGERVGLVGRSGSGKSTLALTFNGIIPQSYAGQMAGRVTVAGKNAVTAPVAEMATAVAMVFQSPDDQMSQILVHHEVASGPANLRLPVSEVRRRVGEALARLSIEHLAERETNTLSGGEKQKVALAAALAMQPRLLVLDEPTTDLDPRSRFELMRTLGGLDDALGMVVVSHDLDTIAPLVQRLVIVDAGAIAADGDTHEIFAEPDVLRAHGIAVPHHVAIEYARRSGRADLEAFLGRPTHAVPKTSSETAIELQDVSFMYPDAAAPAVDNLSLSIRAGEIVAIIGNNGSGKTTLGKLMLGLLKPARGAVRLHGEPVARMRPDLVGYIFQNPDAMLSQMSVAEEIAFTPKLLGRADWRAQTTHMLTRFGLAELHNRYPLALSKGQRQRLAYAAVTAAGPPIFIFDEPTTGIDKPGCDQIMEYMDTLRGEGKTIVFITHDMALAARWADRVVIMHAGRIGHVGTVDSLVGLSDEDLARYHLRLPASLQRTRMPVA
jgi:energy-coupling factor transport system ATP-binding protein